MQISMRSNFIISGCNFQVLVENRENLYMFMLQILHS